MILELNVLLVLLLFLLNLKYDSLLLLIDGYDRIECNVTRFILNVSIRILGICTFFNDFFNA
jgi:hypothetical protein